MHNMTPPQHIAVIMDGNGRWAKARGLPRSMGHKKGVETTQEIVRKAGEAGIPYLTLYAFSTENWQRPTDEIDDLMGLLRFYIKSEAAELHKNNVRLRVIGFRGRLSDDIIEMIERVEALTRSNTGLNLTVALDYGGRQEITRAVRDMIKNGIDPDAIDEETFSSYLFTKDIPDPDLLIRTSGEHRISNFLLWQCAYAEFVFSDVLWPDFTAAEFERAIGIYHGRNRRYGGIETQSKSG